VLQVARDLYRYLMDYRSGGASWTILLTALGGRRKAGGPAACRERV